MKTDLEKLHRYFTFVSWDEFIRYVRETPRNPQCGADLARSDAMDAHSNMSVAERLADIGWLEGAKLGREYVDKLMLDIAGLIERPTINYDVEGHAVDIARMLEGEPECWLKFESERTQSSQAKFLRLVVNVGASGGVRSSRMIQRGAVIVALVEALEMAGTRCEITVVDATGDASCRFGQIHYSASILVKRFDEPVDMPLIAYAVAHPTVLRRHIFRLYETMDYEGCSAGYMRPTEVAPEHRGDLYFDCMDFGNTAWQTEASAIAWVLEQLKKFGVALKSAA